MALEGITAEGQRVCPINQGESGCWWVQKGNPHAPGDGHGCVCLIDFALWTVPVCAQCGEARGTASDPILTTCREGARTVFVGRGPMQCPRDSDLCDGTLCAERADDCPHAAIALMRSLPVPKAPATTCPKCAGRQPELGRLYCWHCAWPLWKAYVR